MILPYRLSGFLESTLVYEDTRILYLQRMSECTDTPNAQIDSEHHE